MAIATMLKKNELGPPLILLPSIFILALVQMLAVWRFPCSSIMVAVAMPIIGTSTNTASESVSDPTKTTTLEAVPHHNNSVQKMRGLILSEQGSTTNHLKIAVPNRVDFREFVGWSIDSQNRMVFNGYSIEVFKQAVKELPYQLNYTFYLFKDEFSSSTVIYDNMIFALSDGKYDAVVGDITIRSNRLKKVDFTQPYLESGLVVVAPVKEDSFSETWAFLRPFTSSMWIATGLFVLFTGLVVWILEHKGNSQFRGPPREQATTVFWFICSTMFFVHKENIKSALGRVVVIVWLFAVLIIVSSYTANLTSILTVKNLSPTIDGINSLKRISSRIGHQRGSFVKDYLTEELHIAKERLVDFVTIEEYARALRLGPNHPNGVAAIVAELPYVQLLLSKECGFAIAGQEFTRSGFGYAFPNGSDVGRDISVAILHLSETGRLQEIHDSWLSMVQCNSELQSNRLGQESFKGLFIITGATSGVCLIIYIFRLMIRFQTYYKNSTSPSSRHAEEESSTRLKVLKSFALYMDESNQPREQGSRNNRTPRVTPGLVPETPSPEPNNCDNPPTQLGINSDGNSDNCIIISDMSETMQ